jgi:hypothetical protein
MKRIALLVLFTAACAKQATPEQAQAACDHEIELGYWKGFDESIAKAGHDPKDPDIHAMGEKALPDQKKSTEWKSARDSCAKGMEHATPDQLTCVSAATTVDAAMACLTK